MLQPPKDMRIAKQNVPYLPDDGPSLPADVRTDRVVNIESVSYRKAEIGYILGIPGMTIVRQRVCTAILTGSPESPAFYSKSPSLFVPIVQMSVMYCPADPFCIDRPLRGY